MLTFLEQYCCGQTSRHPHRFTSEGLGIQRQYLGNIENSVRLTSSTDSSQHLVCGIPSHAGSFKPFPQQDWKAFTLSPNMHDCLGRNLSGHSSLQKLRWPHCLSVYAWFRRSRVLCKYVISNFKMVLTVLARLCLYYLSCW